MLELVYWPAVQSLMWGFLQTYIAGNAGFFRARGGTFLGAVMLWEHPVSRPARLLVSFSKKCGRAHPRQPDDEPVAADRVRRRPDVMSIMRLATGGAGDAAGDRVLRLQSLRLRPGARGFFLHLILTSWAVER